MVGRTKKGVALLLFPGRYLVRETLANRDMYIDESKSDAEVGTAILRRIKARGFRLKKTLVWNI